MATGFSNFYIGFASYSGFCELI